jgi:hypothetical protein
MTSVALHKATRAPTCRITATIHASHDLADDSCPKLPPKTAPRHYSSKGRCLSILLLARALPPPFRMSSCLTAVASPARILGQPPGPGLLTSRTASRGPLHAA